MSAESIPPIRHDVAVYSSSSSSSSMNIRLDKPECIFKKLAKHAKNKNEEGRGFTNWPFDPRNKVSRNCQKAQRKHCVVRNEIHLPIQAYPQSNMETSCFVSE